MGMKECQYQQINNRDCALLSIANATKLAFKGSPGTVRGVSTAAGAFRGICCAVFVWTRKIGLVYLLSIFSANALTKKEAKPIVPAHGALLVS